MAFRIFHSIYKKNIQFRLLNKMFSNREFVLSECHFSVIYTSRGLPIHSACNVSLYEIVEVYFFIKHCCVIIFLIKKFQNVKVLRNQLPQLFPTISSLQAQVNLLCHFSNYIVFFGQDSSNAATLQCV
ncbi:hypothetical protein V1477_004733 [Vespula maculifrons]|uniref:Uncharacterized protein n=1 Tax=Vespula maculifrons TaxID=7453 RepID=A0ABD2CMM8_VESMC